MNEFKLVSLCFLLTLFLCSCMQDESKKQESLSDLQIAYNVLEDSETDNYEIYIMNADGSGKKNISNWQGVDWVYYAYESKIYFISDRDTTHRMYFLYEMDADGKNVRKIYNNRLYDSWISSRKNGEEFIVTTKQNDKKAFVIIDKNGNELKTVLNTNEFKFNDPYFSPDGKQIVYRAVKTNFDELWLMNDDGGNLKQLTYYPENDSSRNPHQYHAGPPFWEPNNNFISYISDQSGNYNIFVIDPDGKNQTKISPDSIDGGWHSWSPQGDWIVFDGTLNNENYDIFILNYKTKELKRLTDADIYEQAPVFVKSK